MSKKEIIKCPECGASILKNRNGTFVIPCACFDYGLPPNIDQLEVEEEGRHIQLELSDTTKSSEKFGS